MKKLVLIGMLLVSLYGFSQSKQGVVAGTNSVYFYRYFSNSIHLLIPYPGWDYKDEFSSKSNFHIGYFYNKKIANHYNLEFELDYSTRGVNEKLTSSRADTTEDYHYIVTRYIGAYKNNYSYLDFSAVIQRQLFKRTWLEVGVVNSLNIYNKIKLKSGEIEVSNINTKETTITTITNPSQLIDSEFKDNLKSFNFALAFGVKQSINDSYFLRFRSHLETGNYPQNIKSNFYNQRRILFQFSIGRTF